MPQELSVLCQGTNIYLSIAVIAGWLLLEWYLPRSRFRASSTVDLVGALAAFLILAVSIVVAALYRRIANGKLSGSRNPPNG